MEIRPERSEDIPAIRSITTAAFKEVIHSRQTEAALIEALRENKALALSLVAVDGGDIVGHVAFSPITINNQDQGWHGLGPVSVKPDRQGNGVGQALIRTGLEKLKQIGSRGCVVLGEPSYYGRFGFETDPYLKLEGAPSEYFMRLSFAGEAPGGEVAYHPAFDAHQAR